MKTNFQNYGSSYGLESDLRDQHPLNKQAIEEDISKSIKVRNHVAVISGLLITAATISLLFVFSGQSPKASFSMSAFSSGSSSHKDTSKYFQLRRENYDPLDYFTSAKSALYKYSILEDYTSVIEPHANMVLYVEDYDSGSQNYFTFSVCKKGDDDNCHEGVLTNNDDTTVHVNIPCNPYDEYAISATEYSASNETIRSLSGDALCMYVRREFRSLSDANLGDIMDAMYTLWSLTEEEGQEKYGSDFHNSTFFIRAHHYNAAWGDGDHVHEGLGFLPQHMKITNMFEKAMQAVDPSVTLPFWDYTIEYSEGTSLFDSPMFQSNTFGSLEPPKDTTWGWTYRNDSIKDGVIRDGRWKHTLADYNWNYPDLKFNYGYMRAPWSLNPSPYISRFAGYVTTLPSCTDFYTWLEYTDFTEFLTNSPYQPHASTHGGIGSVYGCDLLDPLTEQGLILNDAKQLKLCQKWIFVMKELYRFNFISANDECEYDSLTYEGIDCPYVCDPDKYDSMPDRLEALISSKYVGTLSDDQWEIWRDFVCSGDGSKIFVGDHVESASPADPSFWPIHPTLERLYQAKMMGGGFSDMTWPTDSSEDYVCDKAKCYEDDVYGYHDACCYGHYEYDQLLDFVNGDKASGYGPTNHAILADTDPTSENYAASYIYADFSWDHCDEDFESLLVSFKSGAKSSILWNLVS